ncbi:MAG TPA: ABC transporter ATP-binding protein, partial [Candidatus Limnocylindrales bacterium]|nr:ABC transporter ATP-binding protein [Candidatus Limnocylindrales bacterium]
MRDQRPVLEIRDLTVRYPAAQRDALREVSLALQPNAFLSIAGRHGAGKSTLCLAAAGLLPRVVRAGVRGTVAGPTPTGLVLADPAAGLSGARATVREEVAFGLENLGVPRDAMDSRIERALAALGIAGLAGRAPESLSRGEQQRLVIATALAMDPPLLVLDEAAAELDPGGTEALSGL